MERKLKIYLDTSVPNFLFADDAPEKRDITIEFFDNFIKPGKYKTFISEVVIAEIENTKDNKKKRDLYEVLESSPIQFLESN